ncbi:MULTISPECIES: GDYXXLXY domain-containing protein [Bacillus]|uniref:GDYXXLXY domain-containing protein n=1 Tax=Bacillus TaxID=1386 RepID=UPI0002DE12E4|nr:MULTISPECIES: GDYXXLXY domain-containing protein [Bacillus]
MKSSLFKFLITLFVPLLILLGMIVKPIFSSLYGETIVLKTLPLDPTDLFYGDYVTLNLEISEVSAEKVSSEVVHELRKNQDDHFWGPTKQIKVYTLLTKKEDVYEVDQVLLKKPEKGLYIKGKIPAYHYSTELPYYHIDYGIDRYYIEENTGEKIEKQSQTGDVKVVIKLANGYGLIKELQ